MKLTDLPADVIYQLCQHVPSDLHLAHLNQTCRALYRQLQRIMDRRKLQSYEILYMGENPDSRSRVTLPEVRWVDPVTLIENIIEDPRIANAVKTIEVGDFGWKGRCVSLPQDCDSGPRIQLQSDFLTFSNIGRLDIKGKTRYFSHWVKSSDAQFSEPFALRKLVEARIDRLASVSARTRAKWKGDASRGMALPFTLVLLSLCSMVETLILNCPCGPYEECFPGLLDDLARSWDIDHEKAAVSGSQLSVAPFATTMTKLVLQRVTVEELMSFCRIPSLRTIHAKYCYSTDEEPRFDYFPQGVGASRVEQIVLIRSEIHVGDLALLINCVPCLTKLVYQPAELTDYEHGFELLLYSRGQISQVVRHQQTFWCQNLRRLVEATLKEKGTEFTTNLDRANEFLNSA